MYLGPSPTHAILLHLILSIKLGLVLPQFHVRYNDFFESTKWNKLMSRSEWKYKAHIVNDNISSPIDKGGNLITQNDDDEQLTPTSNYE